MPSVVRRFRALWRVLPIAGLAVYSACGDSTAPPKPAAIVLVTGSGLTAVVGQAVATSPTFQVNDDKGKALSGIAFSVTASGGTLALTPSKTTSAPTSVGTWTLGTTAGAQTLTVSVTGVPSLTITATAAPSVPTSSAAGSTPTSATGNVGAVSSLQPSIKITDSFGNPISGIAVTVQITGSGSLQNPSPTTNALGIASVGTWTLGTVAGAQTVTLSAQGVSAVSYVTSVAPGAAASVVASGVTSANGSPQTTSPVVPTVKVLDAFGNGVSGVPITVAISAQGGTVATQNPVTDGNGIATTGQWILGPVFGVQTVTMSASVGTPVTFSVNTAIPAAIAVVAGKFQIGSPSTALPLNPVFKVTNANGDPIPGFNVQFAATLGGGTLTKLIAVTDAQGQASPSVWTLGGLAGTQTLRVTAGTINQTLFATAMPPATGGFTLDVRYVGTPPAANIQTAVTNAATRIAQEVASKLTDATVTNFNVAANCVLPGAPVVSEVIHNIILFVSIGPIDGPSGIIAQSGPCGIRGPGLLPTISILQYDEADLATSVNNGTVTSVLLHEMHHALGYGTLWNQAANGYPVLISGAGTSNPFYLGAAGNNGYLAIGGTSQSGAPIVNTGPIGTRDVHWRESVFLTEVLTGFADLVMPLSSMSILELADLGYSVNIATADPYTVPFPGQLPSLEAPLPVNFQERLLFPRFTFDAAGHPIPLMPPDSGKTLPVGSVRKH